MALVATHIDRLDEAGKRLLKETSEKVATVVNEKLDQIVQLFEHRVTNSLSDLRDRKKRLEASHHAEVAVAGNVEEALTSDPLIERYAREMKASTSDDQLEEFVPKIMDQVKQDRVIRVLNENNSFLVDSVSGTGIADLRTTLVEYIENLEIVKFRVPNSYMLVKTSVTDMLSRHGERSPFPPMTFDAAQQKFLGDDRKTLPRLAKALEFWHDVGVIIIATLSS